MEFDFEAALSTGKDLEKAIRKLTDNLQVSPVARTIPSSQVVANGAATMIYGTPTLGRVWNMLTLSVTGKDDFTVDGNRVAVYIGNPISYGLTDLLLPSSTTGGKIPFAYSWNKDQVFINPGEYVFVVVTGLAAVQISGNIRILDYPRDNRWSKL